MDYELVSHGFAPVFDSSSRVLVLGSLPSVLSRANNFYYGNPKNRFWHIISTLSDTPLPTSTDEKIKLLNSCHIALWDVIAQCEIVGSSDASIKNVKPNDLSVILDKCNITAVYGNGKAAAKFYNRFQKEKVGMDIVTLPSTSPANAAWSVERLCKAWKCVFEYCEF